MQPAAGAHQRRMARHRGIVAYRGAGEGGEGAPASAAMRSAAARSQSLAASPAMATSISPVATRASRSASERPRGRRTMAAARARRSRMGVGPAARAPARAARAAIRRGLPLRVAPWPRRARNSSALTGANRAASAGAPSSTSATEIAQSGLPAMKPRVPSMGSTTHSRRAARRSALSTNSSDSQPMAGSSAASRACSRRLTARSASVTGELLPLVQVFRSVANMDRARAPAACITSSSAGASRSSVDAAESVSSAGPGREGLRLMAAT